MLAIVAPERLDAVLELAARWEVRATVVGRVTATDRFRVFDGLFDAIGVPGENPAPPPGDDPVALSSDRQPIADVPAGSLGDGPSYHRPRRAARVAGRAPGRRPCAETARQVRRRRRPGRRAPRAARDTDDRRQDVGVTAVRPPIVPQHGRRARRRRRGPAGEGDEQGPRAGNRRQGAVLPARSAHGWPARRARGRAQRRDHGCPPARARQLPQLRQPRAPRGHVAVRGSRRRHQRGVRSARHPGDRGERLLLQRIARRRHPSDTGRRRARSHRPARRRAAHRSTRVGRRDRRVRPDPAGARRLRVGFGDTRRDRRDAARSRPRTSEGPARVRRATSSRRTR